jgi:hypothetical protein
MNKIAISLIALAALSTASFASGNRNYDLRDADTYNGQISDNAGVNAFTVNSNDQILSNFDRVKLNQKKNESDSH